MLILSPTLLIVVSIYSICNIHNVTWGSRPDKKYRSTKKKSTNLKEIEIEYKNYRSNFLIIWTMFNTAISKSIQISFFEDYEWVIWSFLVLMVFLYASQLFFSVISMLFDWCKRRTIKGNRSDYFEEVSLYLCLIS